MDFNCIECGEMVGVSDLKVGDSCYCKECLEVYTVAQSAPLRLVSSEAWKDIEKWEIGESG